MTDVTVTVSPLRCRMIEDMSLRNLSPATQRSYLHAVTKFSRYFGRSPDRLGLEDVRAFQVYLVSQGISWGSLNQIVCALRFFYGVTLDRAEIPERIVYARTPRKLPPAHIRSDNSEFIATAVQQWLGQIGVKRLYIAPGSQWENDCNERFNGLLRNEVLNGKIFYSLAEEKVLIEAWWRSYITVRPHSSLSYQSPAPAARRLID